MNDPIDEIFNGTPDGIDEKELKEMNDARAVRRKEINQIESPEEGAQTPPSNQGSQPKEQKTGPSKDGATKENETLVGARTAAESVFAIPTGALDFGVDVINLIPGVDAPKLPKFHNEALQSVRDISSVLLPSVGLYSKAAKYLEALRKQAKLNFLLTLL